MHGGLSLSNSLSKTSSLFYHSKGNAKQKAFSAHRLEDPEDRMSDMSRCDTLEGSNSPTSRLWRKIQTYIRYNRYVFNDK